jgi:hypothetical protein
LAFIPYYTIISIYIAIYISSSDEAKEIARLMRELRDTVKIKILDIYDEFKQNYGAPKITKKLQQAFLISAMNFRISLMSNLTLIVQMLYGAVTLSISGQQKVSHI